MVLLCDWHIWINLVSLFPFRNFIGMCVTILQISFKARRGTGSKSDIAIDSITLKTGVCLGGRYYSTPINAMKWTVNITMFRFVCLSLNIDEHNII